MGSSQSNTCSKKCGKKRSHEEHASTDAQPAGRLSPPAKKAAVGSAASPKARPSTGQVIRKSPAALFDAAVAGDLGEVIEMLRDGTYRQVINDRFGDEQDTALLSSAREGNIPMVCALLAAGADPAQLDSEGWSALHSVATDKAGVPAVEVLLNLAPDIVDLVDQDGWTALMVASQEENVEAVQILLQRNANVNLKDANGRAALHWAAGNDGAKVAKLLYNVDKSLLNAIDADGRTPLIVAAQSGGVEVVKFLKGKGADLTIKDNDGKSALDHAKEEEREDVVAVLTAGPEGAEVAEEAGDNQEKKAPVAPNSTSSQGADGKAPLRLEEPKVAEKMVA